MLLRYFDIDKDFVIQAAAATLMDTILRVLKFLFHAYEHNVNYVAYQPQVLKLKNCTLAWTG
jgi:hypothetical protein